MPKQGKQLYLAIDAGPIFDHEGQLVAVVETLRVGDEPTDVVFAAGKAYIACARSRQIRIFDASTRAVIGAIELTGAYPHALATNADGSRLFAAFLQSGNRTTVIKREVAPAQPAPTNTALPAGPDTALIVAAAVDAIKDD